MMVPNRLSPARRELGTNCDGNYASLMRFPWVLGPYSAGRRSNEAVRYGSEWWDRKPPDEVDDAVELITARQVGLAKAEVSMQYMMIISNRESPNSVRFNKLWILISS